MAEAKGWTRDRLTAPLSVTMTGPERELVREAAFLRDVSVSAFIRAAAVKAANRVVLTEGRKAA